MIILFVLIFLAFLYFSTSNNDKRILVQEFGVCNSEHILRCFEVTHAANKNLLQVTIRTLEPKIMKTVQFDSFFINSFE